MTDVFELHMILLCFTEYGQVNEIRLKSKHHSLKWFEKWKKGKYNKTVYAIGEPLKKDNLSASRKRTGEVKSLNFLAVKMTPPLKSIELCRDIVLRANERIVQLWLLSNL